MSILNLPRASLTRVLDTQAISVPVSDELRNLVQPINTALEELDSDHRCHVWLDGTHSISDSTYTTLTWARPAGWPGGDAYNGYDTGMLSTARTSVTPTKSGLYHLLAQVAWASSALAIHTIQIKGWVEGTLQILASQSIDTTAGTQQVEVIVPFYADAALERKSGGWLVTAYQESGGPKDVTFQFGATFLSVVRIR